MHNKHRAVINQQVAGSSCDNTQPVQHGRTHGHSVLRQVPAETNCRWRCIPYNHAQWQNLLITD